jgi:hypothetical protein
MSFADFVNHVGMSARQRATFQADLQFNLGVTFDHRARDEWERLYTQTLRADRRRRT